jgi:N-acetylneuraminate synthase
MNAVRIGEHLIGDGPALVIAEIGINHSGSIEQCRKLIAEAAFAGAQCVKFQKRTIEVVFSQEELSRPRESPFGTTNGDLKSGLEFGYEEYRVIDLCCQEHGIFWFASPWDVYSVAFLEKFDVPCHKIASACLTDHDLLRAVRATGKPTLLSTGMSTLGEIDEAMRILGDNTVLMHCTSTYPTEDHEINLACMRTLQERYAVPVGYSGHERGIATSCAAVARGAACVERHLTLDRSMWGSDQAASLEPKGFAQMVRDIRAIEAAIGDGVKRVYDSEVPIREKLRRVKSCLN